MAQFSDFLALAASPLRPTGPLFACTWEKYEISYTMRLEFFAIGGAKDNLAGSKEQEKKRQGRSRAVLEQKRNV